MLAVVHDEDGLTRTEVLDDSLPCWPTRRLTTPTTLATLVATRAGSATGARSIHQMPSRKSSSRFRATSKCQPGLSAPARAGERDHPTLVQKFRDGAHLGLSADERRHPNRQVSRHAMLRPHHLKRRAPTDGVRRRCHFVPGLVTLGRPLPFKGRGVRVEVATRETSRRREGWSRLRCGLRTDRRTPERRARHASGLQPWRRRS